MRDALSKRTRYYYLDCRRRRPKAAMPGRPKAIKAKLAGSGTDCMPPPPPPPPWILLPTVVPKEKVAAETLVLAVTPAIFDVKWAVPCMKALWGVLPVIEPEVGYGVLLPGVPPMIVCDGPSAEFNSSKRYVDPEFENCTPS